MARKKISNTLGRNFNRQRKPDNLNEEERSNLMSQIRSRKTKFEEEFLTNLIPRIEGIDYELNCEKIRGKPDIVFIKNRICVFLDSDFWHGWQYPRWKHLLKNDFWREKIKKNRKRDRTVTNYLRRNGWKVLRIWEHAIKKNKEKEIVKVLNSINDCN